MNKALSNLMKEDLESIDSMLRVTANNFGIVNSTVRCQQGILVVL